MAEKTILEKAAMAVGIGIAMAEDLAGNAKTAVGAAVTTVTEVLKKPAATKELVEKVPIKKPVKKAPATKAIKQPATKAASNKTPAKKAVKKTVKKSAQGRKSL